MSKAKEQNFTNKHNQLANFASWNQELRKEITDIPKSYPDNIKQDNLIANWAMEELAFILMKLVFTQNKRMS